MCEPATAISLAAAAISAVGTISKAQAQAANLERQAGLNEANAAIARNNAIAAVQAAEAEADRVDRLRKVSMSRATAAYGGSGVEINDGTPLEVLGDAAAEFELDRLFEIHKGKVVEQDQKYREQLFNWHASQLRSQASNVRRAGVTSAILNFGLSAAGASFSAANPTLGFGASQSQLAGLGYDVGTFSGYNPLGAMGPGAQATSINTEAMSSGIPMGYE